MTIEPVDSVRVIERMVMAAKRGGERPAEGEDRAEQRAVLRSRGAFREERQARPQDNRDAG